MGFNCQCTSVERLKIIACITAPWDMVVITWHACVTHKHIDMEPTHTDICPYTDLWMLKEDMEVQVMWRWRVEKINFISFGFFFPFWATLGVAQIYFWLTQESFTGGAHVPYVISGIEIRLAASKVSILLYVASLQSY